MHTILVILVFVSYTLYAVPVSERVSSYPYISGDTFRAFADHILDETGMVFNIANIKKGDLIFVKTDYLDYFFLEIHPRIKFPYILITHNSDYAVPGNFAGYLDDPKLYAWYGQNIDRKHAKLFPIPIGLANSYWPHGNIASVMAGQKAAQNESKNIILYINYSASTTANRTDVALENLTKLPEAFVPGRKPFQDYILDLAHSVFVVSPPGNGLDCHRTWESLYMGANPIVKHTMIDPLYEDLPVLIVDDWVQVTSDLLMFTRNKINNKSVNLKKIYADYWFDVLNKAKLSCLLN